MKVLHIIGGGDIGGAKTHVLSLVKELSNLIDVKIVSLRTGIFSDEARDMGINIEVVRSGNVFSDIRRIMSIIKHEGYEIIHSHGAKANLFSVIIRCFVKVHTITTVHSDYRLDYLQSVPRMLSFGTINTLALRFIDYYVAVSGNFKKMLVQRKFDTDKIFIVYNGIDFSRQIKNYSRIDFANKYKLNIDDKDIVVGILARLDPVKGINIFVNAAAEVLKSTPQVKFIVGGDGKERKSLEAMAASLGISDNVLFPGWIDDPLEFMSIIDINTLTSLSESFPYVILEGTLLKKATVSSDVGGISDLIENGVTGFLFTPGDHMKLAEHLTLLVNDSTTRKEIGKRIHQKASSHFSLESMCNTQFSIYKKILDKKSQ